ncbi:MULTISPECIES: ABC transporter substrate-binding protein [Pseudoalteromonas]|uniref:Phospholipid transport system substrate-binding protein n=1 Tax=Pseudoalteromonas piscicida TaxID=43662 RepID=A0ABM6NCW8_PSEO7|nr:MULTISPECIES: ABC transporter substrate-binding protein [Pseudoalteromonas]ATD06787.1 phospholipid transport system substrate-binding protein [Pseudoalteromonas piscicida]MBR8841409.1 ABC transporter substrate-binding protein [Pseudoalteromonas sp. JC3]MCF2826943.1 ABC transporter substrate-binding protein [Pseudoalteromonas sp. OF5H-5]MCF2834157.1 ABC transporter substrate-binding protein [Pseudoalteromonas sp. DL2-H6]MCF2923928.1 ABC transporter substrate-binding protein [Pseudoalteromona
MKKLLVIFSFLIFSGVAFANDTPYELINQVGDKLFADIKTVNQDGKATETQMKGIVRSRLMPHIDVKFVSFKLLGKHIKGLKRDEAIEFIGAVDNYLVSTYANALLQYKGQDVLFEELPVSDGADFATVKVVIREQSKPDIDMHFKFRQSKDGDWKVYDMVAEGISLLSAKQKEITMRISEVGLAQVTAELKSKA